MTGSEEHPAGDHDTGLDAFDIYAPGEDTDDPARADSIPDLLFSASNAADSVTVSALMNGAIHRVELSPQVSSMTEAELASEILTVANVAAAKGRAGQYELVSGLLRVQGQDELSSRELLTHGLGLPTPEEAIAAEAALAARSLRH